MKPTEKITKQIRRSGGPRTEAGKARASRNALKHGFAAAASFKADPLVLRQSKDLALAICGDARTNEGLFAHALVVAESDLMLRRISEQKLFLIERLEDPFAIPIAKDTVFSRKRLIDHCWEQLYLARSAASQLETKLITHGEESLSAQDLALIRKWSLEGRDEFDAMREAMVDLERLRRYERRAWSRRHRAIREFIATVAQIEDNHL